MQHKALLSLLTMAGIMASLTSAGALQKRHCASGNRQFCCAVEKVPDREILPNLYLFVYGLGCRKSDKYHCAVKVFFTDMYPQVRSLTLKTVIRARLSPTAYAAQTLKPK